MRSVLCVFSHGWGFSPVFWQYLKPFFSNVQTLFWNLGYFGDLNMPVPHIPYSTIVVGIGHSIGLSKLCSSTLRFDYLIGLQAFRSFLTHDPVLARKRRATLEGVKTLFREGPVKDALVNFHIQCGVDHLFSPPQSADQERLIQDLIYLQETDIPVPQIPTLILGSENDSVTPPDVLHNNWDSVPQAPLRFCADGYHGLGLLKPEWCWQQIRSFLKDIHEL